MKLGFSDKLSLANFIEFLRNNGLSFSKNGLEFWHFCLNFCTKKLNGNPGLRSFLNLATFLLRVIRRDKSSL